MSDKEDRIHKAKKDKWFDVWLAIEALAVKKDIVENALNEHAEKMDKVSQIIVYDKKFHDAEEVEKPMKNVESAFSQVVEIKCYIKDVLSLINTVLLYGPSSVEILGPEKREIGLSEVQNISNLIAGIVHQFAAAGVGGMVMTPSEKKGEKADK